jgi:hypothetical protein
LFTTGGQKKISQSKSPKKKNKSIDSFKMKHNTIGILGSRSKFAETFDSFKKSTGEMFSQMSSTMKKDKENK